MADISELKSRLNDDVARVAAHLLPGGRKVAQEWEAGSISGEAGKSLKVHLTGEKTGVWSDFATGATGDLITLWQQVRGLSLGETLKEIKSWLGIQDPVFEPRQRKTYHNPTLPPPGPSGETPVMQYLTGTRMLSHAAVLAYRVQEADKIGPWASFRRQTPWAGPWIIFPSFHGDTLKFIKYLHLERKDDKKITFPEPGCEPILFGWQAFPEDARVGTITEGEIDAITAWDYGYPGLSVPFGGGTGAKHQWIESEFERLDQLELIYLCMDGDGPGRAAMADLIDRLGRHRCRVVTLPFKDLNECKQQGVTKEQIDECFRNARSLDPEELRNARDFLSDVVEAFYPSGDHEPGMRMPFHKLDGKFLFRAGELTIWTGATGSGKSQILGYAIANGMCQGFRFCVASLEMRPQQFLKRLAKQLSGLDRPSREYLAHIHDFYADRLWLFTLVGKSRVERLIEVFDYARRRYGVTHFVVDSLMRLGVGSEDYEGQERIAFALTDFAVTHAVHVHLVAHTRKADPQKGFGLPGAEDVKGASELGSNASNIIGVFRDKRHEQKLAKAEEDVQRGVQVPDIEDLRNKPGVFLNVSKQRNGDWDGAIALWFDVQSFQYLERYGQDAVRYLDFSATKPHVHPVMDDQEEVMEWTL